MTKAVLLVGPQGEAEGPAILCAESAEEAQAQRLPLFPAVLASLSAGLELSPIGDDYELFQNGRRIGTLEVLADAVPDIAMPHLNVRHRPNSP